MKPWLADTAAKKEKTGRVAYVNARLIDPASGRDEVGGILTEANRIVDLGPQVTRNTLSRDTTVVDSTGLVAAPGLVDMRAHMREPGFQHQETIHTASRSAAVGGITTVACMPATHPPIDDVSLVHFIERRARETSLVKVHTIAALTRERGGAQLTELGLLSNAGAVAFSDGTRSVMNTNVLYRALSYATAFDSLIIHYPEDRYLAGDGVMNDGEMSARLGLEGIPPASECIIVARDIRLAEMTGARLHLMNITTAASIELIDRARHDGIRITADTAPHYLVSNETSIGDYLTFAKVRPPLRLESDRQALCKAVEDRIIDAVASDHTPRDQDSKRQPFAQASFGIVGLETLLPLTLELYHTGRLSLSHALELITSGPATILGLNAGKLEKGGPADIVFIDTDHRWQINAKAFQSKSKNSPFSGRWVRGTAVRTVVNGRTMYRLDRGESRNS